VLAVLPGPLPEAELARRLADVDAAAIIKLGRHFAKVRRVLEGLGLGDRAHYIERATLGRQLVLPLAQVDPEQVPYFSMILVHKRGEAWR
jgi:precorrin-2/cobalt-factor-2 C20-methyltransferase